MQNFRGQKSHPVDEFDFWQNSQEDNEQHRQLYDSITVNMTEEQVKDLRKLIKWCCRNAALDESYNNSPDA